MPAFCFARQARTAWPQRVVFSWKPVCHNRAFCFEPAPARYRSFATNSDLAFFYTVTLLPVVLAAWILETVVLGSWRGLPPWLAWLLTIGPAVSAGAAVYLLVGQWILRHVGNTGLHGVRGHLVRCMSLYVATLLSAM